MKIVSLWSKVSLGLQLLIALILGVLVALIWPQFAAFYQFLGQAFISLINMVIIPLVFPVVVVAVAGVIGKKSFGKLLSKSLLYFFGSRRRLPLFLSLQLIIWALVKESISVRREPALMGLPKVFSWMSFCLASFPLILSSRFQKELCFLLLFLLYF